MATAQVDALLSAQSGSIDQIGRSIDESLADAALGRMMLCRRRAVTAKVIDEFFSKVGSPFKHCLTRLAPQAFPGREREMEAAAAAAEIVRSACNSAPPLIFERALLAEANGRISEARKDLAYLRAAYPGHVQAAVASARLALGAGEPVDAIRSLASVEREIHHIREGAGLLADALRAVGLPEAASEYDLAALICPAYYDSRGNDPFPVDVKGTPLFDGRLSRDYYFESQEDGGIICNASGIYFRTSPMLGWIFLQLNHGRPISSFRRLSLSTPPTGKVSASRRGRLLRHASVIFGAGFFLLRWTIKISKGLRARTPSWLTMLAKPLVVMARRLRLLVRKPIALVVGYLAAHAGTHLREISDSDEHLQLAKARYEQGLSRIFRVPISHVASSIAESNHLASEPNPTPAIVAFRELISEFGHFGKIGVHIAKDEQLWLPGLGYPTDRLKRPYALG